MRHGGTHGGEQPLMGPGKRGHTITGIHRRRNERQIWITNEFKHETLARVIRFSLTHSTLNDLLLLSTRIHFSGRMPVSDGGYTGNLKQPSRVSFIPTWVRGAARGLLQHEGRYSVTDRQISLSPQTNKLCRDLGAITRDLQLGQGLGSKPNLKLER